MRWALGPPTGIEILIFAGDLLRMLPMSHGPKICRVFAPRLMCPQFKPVYCILAGSAWGVLCAVL
jgi:hypothetical protein